MRAGARRRHRNQGGLHPSALRPPTHNPLSGLTGADPRRRWHRCLPSPCPRYAIARRTRTGSPVSPPTSSGTCGRHRSRLSRLRPHRPLLTARGSRVRPREGVTGRWPRERICRVHAAPGGSQLSRGVPYGSSGGAGVTRRSRLRASRSQWKRSSKLTVRRRVARAPARAAQGTYSLSRRAWSPAPRGERLPGEPRGGAATHAGADGGAPRTRTAP